MTITHQNNKNKLPTEFFINKKIYFLVEDLNNYDMDFFKETYDNLNNIVTIKNIPKSNILYIHTSDVKIFSYQEIYINIKLYIESDWVYENIPKMTYIKKILLLYKNYDDNLKNI